MGLSNELSCDAGSFSYCLNPHRFFSWRFIGFISQCWSPGLHGLCRSPVVPPSLSAFKCGISCSASSHLAWSTSHPFAHLGLSAAALLGVLSAWLPISAPPISLDECFFFNSWVVRLPYSLISCQFWLFFVFKLVVVLLFVVWEAQCVYLRLHLGWKS